MSNDYSTPVVLICNVTGRQQKLYHRPYIDELIKKHGSLEALKANYVAKGAAKKAKAHTSQVVVPATITDKQAEQPTVVPAAKINYNDIKPKPSSVRKIGQTEDGDDQFCTVYENYDSN